MDFGLTEEQQRWQQVARRFAYDQLVPASMELDARTDPHECYSPDLIARASQLGLRTLKIPHEFGGGGASCVTEVVVLEELCTGDVGFGMAIQHAWREGKALATLTTDAQRDRFLPDFLSDETYLTSHAVTEDHFGSDAAGSSSDPADGPRTRAERRGDTWVLNGRKSWITNANVARMALILARTDATVPWRDGVSMFLVPTDTPGFGIGRIEDKAGIRFNQNAEIVLQDCAVPADNLLGELNGGIAMRRRMTAGSRAKTAAKCLGVARAAYEEALAFARERVQGGKPIIEHQRVASTLVEMESKLELIRTMMWRAAWCVDEGRPEGSRMEGLLKFAAAETALEVTTEALEIHGSWGVQRGRRMEKLMRDASCLLHLGTALHATKSNMGAALAAAEA